jgi:NitT/TauT family transport system substrate-binding protein
MKLVRNARRVGETGCRILLLAALYTIVASIGIAVADPQPIRIGLARSIAAGPIFIAQARGYFAQEGLDARLEFFDSDAPIPAATADGEVDVGMMGLTSTFFDYATTRGLKVLASQVSDQTGFPTNVLLVDKIAYDAGFDSARDLAHKRIGVISADLGSRYALSRIADRYKLDISDMKTTLFQTPSGEITALSNGQLDAAVLPYITALQIQSAGSHAVIVRLSDLVEWQKGVVAAGEQALQNDRTLLQKFMQAYLRGLADYDLTFLQRDDEGETLAGPRYREYIALIAREAHVDPGLLQKALPYCDRLGRLDVQDIERQLVFWRKQGSDDKYVAPSDLFDLSFAKGMYH